MALLTRKEVSELLKVKPCTIISYERRNLIKPILYINKRPRYDIEDVKALCTLSN